MLQKYKTSRFIEKVTRRGGNKSETTQHVFKILKNTRKIWNLAFSKMQIIK